MDTGASAISSCCRLDVDPLTTTDLAARLADEAPRLDLLLCASGLLQGERARAEKADAVLVSQVVTQRDAHLLNTREMSAAFRESYPSDKRPLLIVGGPRFDEKMAAELGVDRVFGRGTTPGEVASFITHKLTTAKVAS